MKATKHIFHTFSMCENGETSERFRAMLFTFFPSDANAQIAGSAPPVSYSQKESQFNQVERRRITKKKKKDYRPKLYFLT